MAHVRLGAHPAHGTHACVLQGYGYNCIDIDECADGSDSCGDNSNCVNLDAWDGQYECVCHEGYTADVSDGRRLCTAIPEEAEATDDS